MADIDVDSTVRLDRQAGIYRVLHLYGAYAMVLNHQAPECPPFVVPRVELNPYAGAWKFGQRYVKDDLPYLCAQVNSDGSAVVAYVINGLPYAGYRKPTEVADFTPVKGPKKS